MKIWILLLCMLLSACSSVMVEREKAAPEHIYSEWTSEEPSGPYPPIITAIASFGYAADGSDETTVPARGVAAMQLFGVNTGPQITAAAVMLVDEPILTEQDGPPFSCHKHRARRIELQIDTHQIDLDVKCSPASSVWHGYGFQINDSILEAMRSGKELQIRIVLVEGGSLLARLKLETFEDAYQQILKNKYEPKENRVRLWKTGEITADPLAKKESGATK